MNNKDCLAKCLNYEGCKIDLEHFESKCKTLGEELITLRNQYNAAVLVNTKQTEDIKDLQNRYAESSMLFQGDIKELAEACRCAANTLIALGEEDGFTGPQMQIDKLNRLANEYVGDK